MKLSEVLNKYYVLAAVGSEIVGYNVPEPPEELINIHYTMDGDEFDYYFVDQEITHDRYPRGGFIVSDDQGRPHQFVALDGADI